MCFSSITTLVIPKHVRRRLSWSQQNRLTTAGNQMALAVYKKFWNRDRQNFAAKHESAETIGNWNGYAIWPYACPFCLIFLVRTVADMSSQTVGLQALLAAEETSPNTYTEKIHRAIAGMRKYWNPHHSAYCAWHYTDGNDDIYYDDNAQVAIALITAYCLPSTTRPEYLTTARTLISFLMTGENPGGGGVLWKLGSPPMQLNACSTNLSGIAALLVAQHVDDSEPLKRFGQRCSDFVQNTLLLQSGLVKDGPSGGPTWSYNTGAALTVACMLGEEERAVAFATAAVDRNKGLYDQTVSDENKRYWWDETYFVQLLIEGLVTFIETYGSRHEKLCEVIREEVGREMNYMLNELRDSKDGLTWRNWRLYKIGEEQTKRFRVVCEEERKCEYDPSERVIQEKVDVKRRKLCKTLLGSAGSARALCFAGKVYDD